MTNGDLHNIHFNSTQVLADNRANFFSKRWDFFSLAPEACDRL